MNFGDLIENPLRSLSLKISQRLFVANGVSEMSEGERNPERRPGSPLGVAGAEDGAIRSEWNERNERRKRLKKSSNVSDLN